MDLIISAMADEIRIDKQVFHDRLSHFVSAWKADKRSGDALFGGVGSVLILMGKSEETNTFSKNNAMHVSHRGLLPTAGTHCDELIADSECSSGCWVTSSLLLCSCSPSRSSTL